jgi:hypothetical protein
MLSCNPVAPGRGFPDPAVSPPHADAGTPTGTVSAVTGRSGEPVCPAGGSACLLPLGPAPPGLGTPAPVVTFARDDPCPNAPDDALLGTPFGAAVGTAPELLEADGTAVDRGRAPDEAVG